MMSEQYDAGLLGDGGGGNVAWWHDYIRCELNRAHEFYADEIERLRQNEWNYESLARILRDELPLTMTLGLAKILIERMVRERMFADRVGGVVSACHAIAERAEAAKGGSDG